MCEDRSDDETAGLPFQWDDKYNGGLSPPASTVLNSSFSYTGAHHGHSDNDDAERMSDGDEDAVLPASRVESHGLVVWLRTGVSSGNRPTFVLKDRKCRVHR